MEDQLGRVQAFVKLGDYLRDFCDYSKNPIEKVGERAEKYSELSEILLKAEQRNSWFTSENILLSLKHWGELLRHERLETWLSSYAVEPSQPRTVALIMAGNVPLGRVSRFYSCFADGK